jgi:hypothetical protein
MAPQNTSTYLGFAKKTRDVNAHMKSRIAKSKRATFAVMAQLRRIPDLRPKVQIQILKCTVQATMTYGIEACNQHQIKVLQSQANKLLRRAGRWIMGSPVCTANQILQLDLGIQQLGTTAWQRKFKLLHR